MALILSIIYGVNLFLSLSGYRSVTTSVELIFNGILFLGFVLLAVIGRRWPLTPTRANLAIVIMSLSVGFNIFFSVGIHHQSAILIFLVYPIIGTGALLLSTKWFIPTFFMLVFLFGAQIFIIFSPGDTTDLMVHLISSAAVSLAFFIAHRETHLRIEQLKKRDTQTQKELEIALSRMEHAFDEQMRLIEGRKVLEEQLDQSQKMEAVGALAGGIAHGMNNILGAISAYASLLYDEKSNTHNLPELKEILNAAKRGGELTRNLLGFARKGHLQRLAFDLNDNIKQSLVLLRQSLPRGIRIETYLEAEHAVINGDPDQVNRIVVNLCLNAIDAMPNGGTIRIKTREIEIEEPIEPDFVGLRVGKYIQLLLSDTGGGMDDVTRKRVFEPFFTTKAPDKGTGLGLSMVWGAVQSHNGRIRIQSEKERGTTFKIVFPSADVDAILTCVQAKSKPPEDGSFSNRTVLLVDDEPMIRNASKRLFNRLGCNVILAQNGAEALDVYLEKHDEIDLVILDVAMPVMDGSECFQALKEQNSELPIVISSGFADDEQTEKLITKGASGLLPKPYNMDQIVDMLNTVQSRITG